MLRSWERRAGRGRGEAGLPERREHAKRLAVLGADCLGLEQHPTRKQAELGASRGAELGDVLLELGLPWLVAACRENRRGAGLGEKRVEHAWCVSPSQDEAPAQPCQCAVQRFEAAMQPPA